MWSRLGWHVLGRFCEARAARAARASARWARRAEEFFRRAGA